MRPLILLFVVALSMPSLFASEMITIERTFTAPTKNDSMYRYVAFTIPVGTTSLEVEYKYDKSQNAVDIGIFDVNGLGKEGFRGWSGGKREKFFISSAEATPGYLPGPIYPGTWHVIFSLYRVAVTGVKVYLTITCNTEDVAPRPVDAIWQPHRVVRNVPGWYRGDLHMHTEHSDGDQSIAQLVEYAKKHHLDFLALTEHNTCSHHLEASRYNDSEVLLILGEEVTMRDGHANAWGLPQGHWVDFRVTAQYGVAEMIAEVHAVGGLFALNHPFAPCKGCAWGYADAPDVDAIEVWNGLWDPTDYLALNAWEKMLQQGKRVVVIGASDSHSMQSPIGLPTTHVYAENLSQQAILEGILEGRVYITRSPAGPEIEFSATDKVQQIAQIGGTLVLVSGQEIEVAIQLRGEISGNLELWHNGEKVAEKKATVGEHTFALSVKKHGYLRMQISDWTGMIALSNPIYLVVNKR